MSLCRTRGGIVKGQILLRATKDVHDRSGSEETRQIKNGLFTLSKQLRCRSC